MVRKKNSESPVAEELVTPFIDQVDFLKSELKHKNLVKNKLIETLECSPSHFHLSTIKTGKKPPVISPALLSAPIIFKKMLLMFYILLLLK